MRTDCWVHRGRRPGSRCPWDAVRAVVFSHSTPRGGCTNVPRRVRGSDGMLRPCPGEARVSAYGETSVIGARGWAKVVRLVSSSASGGGQATACSCGG